jgi:two-component system phosphate regulon sensor histidine kinase PhoR
MNRTLFRRVVPLYLGALAAMLLLLAAGSTIYLSNTIREITRNELVAIGNYLTSLDTQQPVDGFVQALSGSPFVDGIALLNADQTSPLDRGLTGPPFSAIPDLADRIAEAETSRESVSGFFRYPEQGRWFAYVVAPVGSKQFVVASRAARRTGMQAAPAIGGMVAVSLLIAAGATSMLLKLLRRIDEPLQRIQATARSLAEGDLEAKVPTISSPPELRAIATDLNYMSAQLRDRIGAISTQRNQLEAILKSMNEGVVVLDPSRQIVSMNAAAGELLGVESRQAEGRTLIRFVRHAQLDDLAEAAFSGQTSIERTITLYGERMLHLQVSATPLAAESADRIGTLIVMNDITRLMQLETLRRDFVANVSHELKTPITSIQGFVETLIDDPLTEPDETRRYLQIIEKHTNRLSAIIEDLLSLSRLEHADQNIAFNVFSLASIAQSVDSTIQTKAATKKIDIRWRIDGRDEAWGNRNLLEQALVNLIDNAIKYSSALDSIMVEMINDTRELIIRVSDRGQGIVARDLPRVFERFYRTDAARSRELGGTGLGLAIVKHIARAHHGTVHASSIYGEGSTFTIEIPQSELENRATGDGDHG